MPFPSPSPRLAFLVAAALAGASACGPREEVAVDASVRQPARTAVDAAVDAGEEEPFVEIRVRRGQTLWDIAQAYDVELHVIREFNHLTRYQAKHLREGQVLRIPGIDELLPEDQPDAGLADAGLLDGGELEAVELDGAVPGAETLDGGLEADGGGEDPVEGAMHVLGDGETLWDVARTYDTTVDEILRANQWDDDDARSLVAGSQVLVPGVSERRVRAVLEQRSRHTVRYGIRVRLERGESIWTLANRYHVSVAEIMAANSLTPRDVETLSPGRQLLLPGVTREAGARAAAPPRPLTPMQERALRLARRLGLGNRNAAGALLHGHVSRRWVAAAGGRSNRLPGTLRWPVVNGRFVRGYGSGEGGYHLATDIAGDLGWNVRASAPGIVGYSGNELSGFGNVVLVVHPGGWVTLYAHNSVNFVVAGQRVRAGTILAEVGSTGRSQGPHVHFELIYAGKNCDPSSLFRPGIRHRNRLARIPKLEWTNPSDVPDAIDCAPRRRHPSSDLVVNE
ncbi:MAG: LysM peptidoglycan-binding domain-containing protein [Polyangiales bacterium]